MEKININRKEDVLKDIVEILSTVSKDEGLYIDYARICFGAMRILDYLFDKEEIEFPINMSQIYEKLNIEILKDNLNDYKIESDPQRINRIIGKISIRPSYEQGGNKISVYIDENAAPALANYALAHELAHIILNYRKIRYTDAYCIMPMLPQMLDEIVADAFAVFLMIPFDIFLEIFNHYITLEMKKGNTPITTETWFNYLGSVTAVPHYYIACAYQQIRHVAYLMYHIHIASEEKKIEYREQYGTDVMELYEKIKDKLNDQTINMLFQ